MSVARMVALIFLIHLRRILIKFVHNLNENVLCLVVFLAIR